jgi:16S rRNA (guanine(966)-N(2))-methyltransferase RsmD
MRIIAGALKGRRLDTPRGAVTRPTTDQVRTALMDALTPWLGGAHLLDIFAGAGGVGLEALSRGAGHVTFVERDARAVTALRHNITGLGLDDRARVLREDALRALARLEREAARFHLAFLDPPYQRDLTAPVLIALGAGRLLIPPGIVVAQHLSKRPPEPEAGVLQAYRTRRFGETTLTFFRRGDYDSGISRAPTGDR